MGKLKKYYVIFIFTLIAIFLSQGCIGFHPDYAQRDKDRNYIMHYTSCGPKALSKALKSLGHNVTSKDVSIQIQSTGNLKRHTLSIIHYEAVLITWPQEVKNIIKKYGYEIKNLNSLSELNKEDVAVVLVSGSLLERQWHWMSYPTDKNIKNYFPEGTKIVAIYKIKKPRNAGLKK